ncbi:MAG: hypothetical protein J0H02_17660 [Armatimonadetes bacterium]|nr:hypothetical protein [Armatimonadota bacterium]
MERKSEEPEPKQKKLIFRAWYIHPGTKEKIYAWQYGKKAFAIWVDVNE